jgi:hypothetical protein
MTEVVCDDQSFCFDNVNADGKPKKDYLSRFKFFLGLDADRHEVEREWCDVITVRQFAQRAKDTNVQDAVRQALKPTKKS